MNRPRAADDFATIRARLDELRREREQAHAAEGELQRNTQTYPAETCVGRRQRSAPGQARSDSLASKRN